MLTLHCRVSESIMVGDHIEIKLLGAGGQRAVIGFQAPPEIRIYRKKVYEKIKAQALDTTADATADPAPAAEEATLGVPENAPAESTY